MLKKDLYAIAYVLTALIVAGSVAYYVFVLQKDVIDNFNEDPAIVQVAARQSTLGQQIVKAAIGMGYSKTERNFSIFQTELGRILPEWRKGHEALLSGSSEMGISAPSQTSAYLTLQENLKFFYNEMNINATNLMDVVYTNNDTDINALALRSSIETLINTIRKYQIATDDITDYFVEEAQSYKSGYSLVEKIVFGFFVGFLILQGLFVFRPLVKLASDNYLSANKAYVKVKKSEEQLKINFQKQKLINKKLYQSRKELEEKNTKLQESEAKLLRSSEEQIRINEKLISAQDELNLAYKKLQDSEEEIRELADKQLQDNEKLFLAEKKLKETLKKEQESKEELNNALQSLKSAQSQLVHSEKMASLGQLTAGIAHEINNPINFISSGMVSIKMSIESLREIAEEYSRLDEGADPAEVIENVKELKEEHEYEEILEELDELIKDVNYGVTRTIEIVKGLRVFSRLDEEEVKSANVNENIDATLTLLRNKTKNRIKVSKYYDENMNDIECFPGQLNQVFMNILNNGIQAIPEDNKEGELTIYTEELEDEVVIRLKDNGVGIPEKIKNRIWEPFFTTKAVGVGTGLGMSITYGIIEKHGGKIEFTSEENQGTEFVITLPKKVTRVKQSQDSKVAESK
ncbi:ATP-binding protein [Marinoscillum furvescens]|uniref:histidine kinase n=1 Tax=Marinoscillum furvescens DSM 4134 TaxID=1122208 RepID=A0A3D9L755_MARFU|nr:ATP-binding protein [Marinoscillum furvescens]REE02178.1 phospho-acceptor domain-containing protein [Marinoscillum furvescens DSM 4134]